MNNTLQELKIAADKAFGKDELQIILPQDQGFSKAWEISNSYFYDRNPAAVAFPKTTEQVSWCVMQCNKANIQFRVRSGGHQHEAMCTSNGTLMIRLSKMSGIDPDTMSDPKEAWIASGAKLNNVYKELGRMGKTIPGGGCGDVNVGGLTQGGGWGLYSRKAGLTCDSVLEAEVVLADGRVVTTNTVDHPDLFWAIRGGGGGNFGIVTRFRFQLLDLVSGVSRYRFYWKHHQMEDVVKNWMKYQDRFPDNLTSFLRLQLTPDLKVDENPYPIYASGLFQGYKEELMEIMKPLVDAVTPDSQSFETIPSTNDSGDLWANWSTYDVFDDSFTSIEPFIAGKNSPCDVPPPTTNCGAPHPHKVSSAFPIDDSVNDALAQKVVAYMTQSVYNSSVRSYVSFHSMGGAIRQEPQGGRAFPYNDKAYMLQFQSWWNYPENAEDCKADRDRQQVYIDWVKNFRESLKPYVEGAFINFVDKDLGPDPSTPQGRIDLLREYYSHNLERLMEVKTAYDPDNHFDFEMSIPRA